MLWFMIGAGFLLAATMGAALAALFTTMRPDWSRTKRRLVAASILPAICLIAGLGLAIFGYSTADQMMRDVIFAAILAWAGGASLLAFVGGLFGSLASARSNRG